MLIQSLAKRNFLVNKKSILKVHRGTREDKRYVHVTPGSIIEVEDAFGKKLVKNYKGDLQAYGVEKPIREAKKVTAK